VVRKTKKTDGKQGQTLPILNSLHLLEQADMLLTATPGRKPRQVNLRRSISTAYCAVFPHVLTAAADQFVGKGSRSDSRYALVYRSVDHRTICRMCEEAARLKVGSKFEKFLSKSGFDREIGIFSDNFVRLQKLRHIADYDPGVTFTRVEAMFSIYLARQAIEEFNAARSEARAQFLTLLLFPPR
jgi:hypothetical protein